LKFKKYLFIIKAKGEERMMIMERSKLKAVDIAMWFIKRGYDQPRNSLKGNMKLQKLLYFSQLIHLAKYGETLFSDNMYAFRHGTVIEDVRVKYRVNHHELVTQSYNLNEDFAPEVMDTLNLTIQIFGSLDADELSELNHQQFSWNESYYNGYDEFTDFHIKEESIINVEMILEHDLEIVREMLSAFENSEEPETKSIKINGVTFYYDPRQTLVDDQIKKELQEFAKQSKENTYSFYIDDNLGIVIF
jgi:uncharacterized phage-associated protein